MWNDRVSMELGTHLPLMEFAGEGQSLARIRGAAEAARDCGFAAVSANDHFLFSTPWLDGPTALAAVIEATAPLELATTVSLLSLRGPVPLAKSLAAIDRLSGGRLIAGVGPGSSERDYDAVGIAFDDRWPRFEEAVALLRSLLTGDLVTGSERFGVPDASLAPAPEQPAASRSGSEAGVPPPAYAALPGLPTGGSPPPTTPPPPGSPKHAGSSPRPCRARGVRAIASPTGSPRCGPGSRRTAQRPTGCCVACSRRF